ncbi:hypothetical protein F5883DRAFT_442122, partial [Diaporthe sp. PMI_573]
GTIPNSRTAAIIVLMGWVGNIAMFNVLTNGSKLALNIDSSLIKASFIILNRYNIVVANINMSYIYVALFSITIFLTAFKNSFNNPITYIYFSVVIIRYNFLL